MIGFVDRYRTLLKKYGGSRLELRRLEPCRLGLRRLELLSLRRLVVLASMGVLAGASGCSRDDGPSTGSAPVVFSDPTLRDAMLDEEDARGTTASGIQSLREGLIATDPVLQRLAVRGIGRLEDPEFIPLTFPLLFSDDETVRAEAVNAMAQAAFGAAGDEVAEVLFEYLVREAQEGPAVRGVIGRTLGRIYYNDQGGLRRAEETLLELTREGDGDAPLPALMGAVMGLEQMARRRDRYGMSDATVERLTELAAFGRAEDAARLEDQGGTGEAEGDEVAPVSVGDPMHLGDPARIRRVALMALSGIGELAPDVLRGAIRDSDPDVRRLAATAIGRSSPNDGLAELLVGAISDPLPRVRVAAVTALAAQAEGTSECPLLFSASRDEDLQVALTALDLLQQTCDNRERQDELLSGLAAGLETAGPLEWHRGAHALVSLATVSPDTAALFVEAAAGNSNPFVRTYAGYAAARMGRSDVLQTLAEDASPNVRYVAVRALFGIAGHNADAVLIAQLEQDDPQLLLTVAGLLEGTPNAAGAIGPLVAAFTRISQEQRETARDPRMALLDRIAELGGGGQAVALEPYLNDYDSVVATRTAEILTEWTGAPRTADPAPLARQTVPLAEEVQRLSGTSVILEMARGGEIEIRLFAEEAPTHAARFRLLVGLGAFDGLTFHRVVSNFVIQGGSPDANEYSGDAAYTRDELGLVSHWRGTVGASTRGRDTGDGQIFINLVDNLSLDHDYTVFGEVVRGMDIVDRVAEGDVIVQARVVVQ